MVAVKLTDEEKEMLERVVESWREEAKEYGTVPTASGVIRTLIVREAKARGLDKPGKSPAAKKGTKR